MKLAADMIDVKAGKALLQHIRTWEQQIRAESPADRAVALQKVIEQEVPKYKERHVDTCCKLKLTKHECHERLLQYDNVIRAWLTLLMRQLNLT